MSCRLSEALQTARPVPQGAGGLKFELGLAHASTRLSRPARGGWIEIPEKTALMSPIVRPVPQGAGGLKFLHDAGVHGIGHVPSRKGRVD